MTMGRIAMPAILVLVLAWTGTSARAADRCHAGPRSDWKPQLELERWLGAQGWRVKRVKVEDGCFEVHGADATGQRTEALFSPRTFERTPKMD